MLYNAKQWHFPASPEQYKSGYPSGYYSLGKGVKARLVGTTMRADRWTAPSRQLLGTTHGMAARQPSVRRGVAAFGRHNLPLLLVVAGVTLLCTAPKVSARGSRSTESNAEGAMKGTTEQRAIIAESSHSPQ